MSVMYVEFLISKGQVTEFAADRIRQWALCNREPIGMIAVDHGLIIGRQIDEVLDRQRESKEKFGQIATELGFVNQERVDVLLQIQRYRVLTRITEALALAGLIPIEDGASLVAEFVREHPEEVLAECATTKTP